MSNESLLTLTTAATALFAPAFAVALALWRKARVEAGKAVDDRLRAEAELERVRRSAEAAEKSLLDRMGDKDAECARLLDEKSAACRELLESKDAACRELLASKDAACASAVAEKELACSKMLSEKDAALARRDEDCRRAVAEKNEEIGRFLQEKEKAFAETVKTLREQFANIAAERMKAQSADLSSLNRAQIESLMSPLREQLARLQDLTQKAQGDNARLGESMSRDVDAIGRIAKELSGVATALSSDTRYQGRRGEDVLAEKLRQAGLEENVNFFLQRGTDKDRPDAQVCDTENRWLIIDSKVSLTAYMEYMDAKDEKTKEAKLAAHVASVRAKIDQLAKKKYPKVFGEEHRDRNYLPITAMFVAYEAPLMEALKAQPSLWQYAAQNDVILITPLTLLAYIRLVYLAWQHEKESRNLKDIVDAARELLSRTNGFLRDFEEIGEAIVSLSAAYDKAKGLVVSAPHAHTIANSAMKLIDLHVKLETKKGRRIERAECLKDVDDEPATQIEERSGC